MAKSPKTVSRKFLDEIPEIEEIEINKLSPSEPRRKQKPGFYWREKHYENESALIKAVTAEVRKVVRDHLARPVTVVGRDGAVFAQQFNLARLELQLVDPPMRKAR
jgi:hypothetical protein